MSLHDESPYERLKRFMRVGRQLGREEKPPKLRRPTGVLHPWALVGAECRARGE
jgi:hypothetical protein